MNINPLSSNLIDLLANQAVTNDSKKLADSGESSGSFASILNEAYETASETDTVDKISSLELLMGQTDDLSGLMLDMQKAEMSLNLALQIRNKIVDAYDEIMRMQV